MYCVYCLESNKTFFTGGAELLIFYAEEFPSHGQSEISHVFNFAMLSYSNFSCTQRISVLQCYAICVGSGRVCWQIA